MEKDNCQKKTGEKIEILISKTSGKCQIGESVGAECIENKSIPVISCEGGCIKGEIARLAANYVSKYKNFKRGCHGEFFTVPDSNIAKWFVSADKLVIIDGCFLKCHSRIIENMLDPSKLIVFDAQSHYKRYANLFDIDAVPEEERKEVAREVSEWVIKSIEENNLPSNTSECGCRG